MRQHDLAAVDEHAGVLAEAAERLGDLFALVNAGALLRRRRLEEVTAQEWDAQHAVNLKGAFFLARAAAEIMRARGRGGRIVSFSSAAWLTGPAYGSDAYAASKAGVVTMSRGLARAYGPDGILVNVIAPGQIDTPMQHRDNSPEVIKTGIEACPLRRLGRPEEVAAVAVFLASEHASFITGATINVSGGLLMY